MLRHLLRDIKFKPYEQVWLWHNDQLVELQNVATDRVRAWEVVDDLPSGSTVLHSHVHSNSVDGFSLEDWKFIEQHLDLKHYVYHVPSGADAYYDACLVLPYRNRDWSWSVNNCYSLVKDWYARELNITLPVYRLERNYGWSEVNFVQLLVKHGCHVVNEPQLGDIVVMAGGHLGIWLSPTELLHHPAERKSMVTRQLPGQYWRHPQVAKAESVTLLDPEGKLLVTNTLQMPITASALAKLRAGTWRQSKGYRLVTNHV